MYDPYIYVCEIVKVVDGDTIDVNVDLGWSVSVRKQRIRLYGIDAPESRTRDLEEKQFGKASKKFVKDFLNSDHILLKTREKGKYGRYLGDFCVDDKWLCDEMIQAHHAVPYYGQNKADIAAAHIRNRALVKL
ncbi:MAG: nuclease [Gammaproteobacteria bacterium]|nr:nuclease [Gammaproteobacteria bacterium]MAC71674.1 nuclease [Gammaproteobacteria bacterium]|tara:strand:- start:9935 stop:10333 length:399 start_codon:yes stop_codon:yes gene_type:complete